MLSSHQPAKQACSAAAKQRTIAAHQLQHAAQHLHQLAVHQLQYVAQLQHQFAAHQHQFAAHQHQLAVHQLLLAARQLQLAAHQQLRSVACFHVWGAASQPRTLAAATRTVLNTSVCCNQSELPQDARFVVLNGPLF